MGVKIAALAPCLVALLLAASGCTEHAATRSSATPTPSPVVTRPIAHAVPARVLWACGHPGRSAVLTVTKIVIEHTACDLHGVRLVYQGVGVTVPERGQGAVAQADGPSGSSTTSATVDASTGDVTFQVSHS